MRRWGIRSSKGVKSIEISMCFNYKYIPLRGVSASPLIYSSTNDDVLKFNEIERSAKAMIMSISKCVCHMKHK